MIVTTAFMCMTLNVYMEARSEPMLGQRAVALVTWNRAGRDPDKVCEVVFKDKQFSWANGRVTKLGYGYRLDIDRPSDKKALQAAKNVAKYALKGILFDFTKGADHYHATYVSPDWKKRMVKKTKIGKHVFYEA